MGTNGSREPRTELYERIIAEHPTLRDRLRALIQAGHDGYNPRDVEAVRAAIWAVQGRAAK